MDAFFEDVPGDRTINGARIDVNKTEPPGELSRHAAFSRGSRTINRDYPMKISLRRVHRIGGPQFSRALRSNATRPNAGTPERGSLPRQLSSGGVGVNEPITGVLTCIRFGFVNSSSTASNP